MVPSGEQIGSVRRRPDERAALMLATNRIRSPASCRLIFGASPRQLAHVPGLSERPGEGLWGSFFPPGPVTPAVSPQRTQPRLNCTLLAELLFFPEGSAATADLQGKN